MNEQHVQFNGEPDAVARNPPVHRAGTADTLKLLTYANLSIHSTGSSLDLDTAINLQQRLTLGPLDPRGNDLKTQLCHR